MRSLLAGIVMLIGMGSGLTPRPADAAALRELTEADEANWKGIHTALLSPDGQWFAYASGPFEGGAGEAVVVLRAVHADTERRYRGGDFSLGGGHLKMSPSGRWIAFHVAPDRAESAEPIRLAVALIETGSGARHDFKAVKSFEFVGGAHERILLQGYPAVEGGKSFDLAVRSLSDKEEKTIAGVVEFAVSPPGTHIAWADSQRLQNYDVRSGRAQILDALSGGVYEKLTWSKRGNALAMLRKGTGSSALVTFTELERAKPRKTMFDAGRWVGFPEGYAFAPSVQWREDERGLFFGIRALPPPPATFQALPNLAVWHWRDEQLPGEKKHDRHVVPVDWCFVDLTQPRFIRLGDATLRNVALHDRGHHVLGYDVSRHGWQNKSRKAEGVSAPQIRDYYLADLRTGQRKLLVRGLRVVGRPTLSLPPQLSPDGSIFLYQNDDGDIVAHDVEADARRNLTSQLPTKFYLPENDPKTGRQPRDSDGQGMPRVQGWTGDGQYVLVSDHYDIWALPLRGGHALNLTGNGRRENLWYRRVVLTEPVQTRIHGSPSSVNLSAPIYFHAFELDTGRQGLVRRIPGRGGLETLNWEYADVRYLSAERADVYLYMRQTAVDAPDYYRIGADWKPDKRLTDINPQQREFRWSPEARYLTYKTANRDTRHAVLHLPAGYVEGQAYPTIVQIYTGLSATVHAFRTLGPNSHSRLLQRGYAVLLPDIVPRVNEAGRAALEDVLAAIDAAVASGIVDRSRLGLWGFSYGGYETNFIVTQTDLFKAAVAWAGATNLWSLCGGVYQDRYPKSIICERSQPFLGGPWWKHWGAYLNNSPLFNALQIKTPLLLVHGDQDRAVPFSQATELFNTLRRIGDKPVVLLEYKGEDHTFGSDAQRDVERRKADFFDHFLKGAPPPSWWSDGISLHEQWVSATNGGS